MSHSRCARRFHRYLRGFCDLRAVLLLLGVQKRPKRSGLSTIFATSALRHCVCVFIGPSCGLSLPSFVVCLSLQKWPNRSGLSPNLTLPSPADPVRRLTCSFYRVLRVQTALTLPKPEEFEGSERPSRRRRLGLLEPSSSGLGRLRPPRRPAGFNLGQLSAPRAQKWRSRPRQTAPDQANVGSGSP